MSPEDFDACFVTFAATAFRYEGRDTYLVPEETERIEAFRRGEPRPERSVRTSPWLARIATTTITEGKRWQRVIVLAEPLTDYQRYRITGLIESQAAGEEIRVFAGPPGNAPDFWAFDDERAVVLDYDEDGRFTGTRFAQGQFRQGLLVYRGKALAWSVPLNTWLAERGLASRAA